jgi:outer membrane protein assembly factor BamB
MKNSKLPALATLVSLLIGSAFAADWPQWRGPDRTDVSKETGLLKSWPKDGPALLWTYDQAGDGFAGLAIVGNVLYTMGSENDKEYAYALDLKTRKKLWNTEIDAKFSDERGEGPRTTPTVSGDFVFTVGCKGTVTCLDKATGDKKWSVSMEKDLGGKAPNWGYSESPLVDGDQVIVSPGGSKGGIAALNKKTGAVIWQCKDLKDGAGHASAIVADVQGVHQYIQTTSKGVAGVDAKTGDLLWYYPESNFKVAVIPTPIYKDGFVYATSGYGAGCDLLKLTKEGGKFKAEKEYANKNMVNHHGGVVLVGDYLYGYSDGKGWVCQNFKTGEVVWSDKSLGKGSVTCADDHLYCYDESTGTCVLAEASPKGWKETGRFKIPQETKIPRKQGKIWTHPVVANGKLYLRDHDLIFCYNVQEAQ